MFLGLTAPQSISRGFSSANSMARKLTNGPDGIEFAEEVLSHWKKHGHERLYPVGDGDGYVDVNTARAHDLSHPEVISDFWPETGDLKQEGDYYVLRQHDGAGDGTIVARIPKDRVV